MAQSLLEQVGAAGGYAAAGGIAVEIIRRMFGAKKSERTITARLIDTLIQRVDSLQARVDKNSLEHARDIDELRKIHQGEIDSLRDLYNERIGELDSELQAWKKKYADLDGKYKLLQSDYESLKQRVVELSGASPIINVRPAMQRASG